jgi:hypothetical protein
MAANPIILQIHLTDFKITMSVQQLPVKLLYHHEMGIHNNSNQLISFKTKVLKNHCFKLVLDQQRTQLIHSIFLLVL